MGRTGNNGWHGLGIGTMKPASQRLVFRTVSKHYKAAGRATHREFWLIQQPCLSGIVSRYGEGRNIMTKLKQSCDAVLEGVTCLLYTSDAADEEESVDRGCRRILETNKRP